MTETENIKKVKDALDNAYDTAWKRAEITLEEQSIDETLVVEGFVQGDTPTLIITPVAGTFIEAVKVTNSSKNAVRVKVTPFHCKPLLDTELPKGGEAEIDIPAVCEAVGSGTITEIAREDIEKVYVTAWTSIEQPFKLKLDVDVWTSTKETIENE